MSVATALAGDLSYTSYEEIGLESLDVLEMRLRNICGLFVVIDDGYVFLIHQSAKDYLLAKAYNEGRGDWRHSFHPPEYENLLTSVCICLLSFECFSSDPLPKEEELGSDSSSGDDQGDNLSAASNDDLNLAESYNDSHPLFEYAAKYWTEHCRLCKHESQQEWLPRITALCDARSTTFKRWFAIYRRIDGGHLPQKTTSLNVAAHLKFLNVLQYFLDQGEDPNERDGHGAVPLQRAAQESFKATKLLVDAGADVNADGWEAPYIEPIEDEDGLMRMARKLSGTPLCMAIYGGSFETVQYLVQNGASVNSPTDEVTPLFLVLIVWGVSDMSLEIFQFLIKHGANVNETSSAWWRVYTERWAPIHYAANPGIRIEALEALVNSENIDINAQILPYTSEEDHKRSSRSSDDSSNTELKGMTALDLAINERGIDAVKLLLQHGADVHIRNETGKLPMDRALSIADDDTSKREIIELLRAHGADAGERNNS
jgi:ankyrin repeat protein